MKCRSWGFSELVAVIPSEVIATLKAVMGGNLLHRSTADGVLHVRLSQGVLHLSEPDLFEQRHGTDAEGLTTVLNDGGA